MRSVPIVTAVMFIVGTASATPAQTFVFRRVVAGSAQSFALDISHDGHIVGTASLPGGELRAFVLDLEGSAIDIGTLGGPTSKAQGVNGLGVAWGAQTPIPGCLTPSASTWGHEP